MRIQTKKLPNVIAFSIPFLVALLSSSFVVGVTIQPSTTSRPATVQDDLAPKATWKPATSHEIKSGFQEWLTAIGADKATLNQTEQFLVNQLKDQLSGELVDTIVRGTIIGRPDLAKVLEAFQAGKTQIRPPEFSSILENPQEADFLRDHLRLYYGRWLAQNKFYDEALLELNKVKVDKVLDRGTLLFYRGLMEHQLLKKNQCLKTITQLLENTQTLPRRYEVLSKLMLADIKPMKADSLDEISRMMADIRRRTKLSRSGKIVLKQEQDVIKKLDKLIEELEAQQQSQSTAESIAPSSPMQDSQKAAGKGSGKVTSKRQKDGGDWGDLPPAERAAALAEMAKDMPPHYRAVIEEYFKKLAEQDQ